MPQSIMLVFKGWEHVARARDELGEKWAEVRLGDQPMF